MIGAHGDKLRFDRFGRLIAIVDAVKDSAETGNEIRFTYDAASRLVDVTDSLDRHYSLDYDEQGRLVTLEDFDERKATYEYDVDGRLYKVIRPPIQKGESKFPGGLTTTYQYASAGGDLAGRLNSRDNLSSTKDARDKEWLSLTYTDQDNDGRADEVKQQTWGDRPLSITFTFEDEGTKAVVVNRRGETSEYDHSASGHVKELRDQAAKKWSFETDAEGLMTSRKEALGRATIFSYDTESRRRRSRGNLLTVQVTADGRGANGSAGVLTTSIEYDPRSNLPSSITDPRGIVTLITRHPSGLPSQQVVAADPATTYTYNAFGQLETLTNPNGHLTRYEYFEGEGESEESEGYLRKVTVDENELALATTYETDSRGNVTKVTDPRGVRHETDYNEDDWPVETRVAVTGADDGASALSYRTKLLYDANGNRTESWEPYGDSGEPRLKTKVTYGLLNEVTEVKRDVEPGGASVATTYEYDENYNLFKVIDPEQHRIEYEYDERDLAVKTTRGLGPEAPDVPVVVRTTYDDDRQPTETVQGEGNGEHVWPIEYDGFGRLAKLKDPLGNRTEVSYDAALDATRKSYSATGELLAESKVVLDRQGRQQRTIAKLLGATPTTPPRDVDTVVTYDPMGNVVIVTDPRGKTSTFTYDGAERLKKQTDPAGNEVELTLDRAGNATREERHEQVPEGSPVTVATTHGYDALGRRLWSRDALNNETRFTYDARSNRRDSSSQVSARPRPRSTTGSTVSPA